MGTNCVAAVCHDPAQAGSPQELFRCPDLLVRKVAPFGGACCVVTFDSFTDHRTLDRPGFGETFFRINGIDAVHVIPRENAWYHYPEMADAMAAVKAATRGYDRVLTYGSSMGAYAAIRFAGLAGANAVLALSPQFSIAPATVPWEVRWTEHGRRFDPRWERSLALPKIPEAWVLFDPTDKDIRHIAALARGLAFQAIRMPHAGHPVTGCLAEMGLLHGLVTGLCRGDVDMAQFQATLLEKLPRSSQHLTNRAKKLPRWRHQQRLAMMRQAVTVAPQDPSVYRCLGIELRKARLYDESLAMHRKGLELLPNHPNLMLEYSFTLAASGDLPAAIDVVEDIHRRAGGVPIYQAQLRAMRARLSGSPLAMLRRAAAWLRERC